METRSKRAKRFEIVNRALRLELLLDMILDYVIHGYYEKAISNIRSCRLVCKDWLQSTSRILLRCQEPLFQFRFITSLDNHVGDVLDAFVGSVSGPSRLHDRAPSFAIRTYADLVLTEHRQSFFKCLVYCGTGLVELSLQLPKEKIALAQGAQFSFPILQNFPVLVFRGSENNMDFVQSILVACQQLKFFELTDFSGHLYPQQMFVFPPSITELNLTTSSKIFEALEQSCLPVLKTLNLKFLKSQLKHGLITNILEKVRSTLAHFRISPFRTLSSTQDPGNQVTTFRLPLMEKLQELKIETEYLELERNFLSLEHLVPVLSHMTLDNQTASAFRKWTDSSCFSSVTCLVTSLSSLTPRRGDEFNEDNNGVNFDVCTMESMKMAFPNLRILRITIYGADTSALVFVMKEMKNLRSLTIDAVAGSVEIPHMEFWNALLLGIPIESVVALKESPELWEDLQNESTVSIQNMSDLHTLDLSYEGDGEFELSSAVFQHAFFKMPNLSVLLVTRRFSVSKELRQAWKNEGRYIGGGLEDLQDLMQDTL